MPTKTRAVIVADPRVEVIESIRRALQAFDRAYPLMVLFQPVELRQYLLDAVTRQRVPALVVLNGQDPEGVRLMSWMRTHPSAIRDIPIIAVGAEWNGFAWEDVSVMPAAPTANAFEAALKTMLVGES